MFRIDLSALSTRSHRTADRVPYKTFEDSAKTPERKQRSKNSASSPARTAKTQTSSTCSVNLNTTHDSIELDFLPSSSSSGNKISDDVEAWALDFALPPKQDGFRSGTPSPPSSLTLIRSVPSSESFGKKSSTFSERGRRASLVGKTVLKSLRKSIPLMKAASSDSGNSSKMKTKMLGNSLINAMSSDPGNSKMKQKIRRNRSKSLPMIPREVMLNVVEGGEGVEMTTDSSKSDCNYNTSRNVDIHVPKIIRETSTYATTSLTSGEDSAEIYDEDDDIRKLCDLMKKIRNHSQHEADEMRFDSDHSSPSDSLGDSLSFSASGPELEEDKEACREPCQTTDCIDLMMFVNNEHKVLEYAPDEFQEFGSEFVSET